MQTAVGVIVVILMYTGALILTSTLDGSKNPVAVVVRTLSAIVVWGLPPLAIAAVSISLAR